MLQIAGFLSSEAQTCSKLGKIDKSFIINVSSLQDFKACAIIRTISLPEDALRSAVSKLVIQLVIL